MKMDIEGAEYDVIPACSKSALRRCKRIFLETHVMRDNGNDKPGHTSVFLKEYQGVFASITLPLWKGSRLFCYSWNLVPLDV